MSDPDDSHGALRCLQLILEITRRTMVRDSDGQWLATCPIHPAASVRIEPRDGDIVWVHQPTACPCPPQQIITMWQCGDRRIIPAGTKPKRARPRKSAPDGSPDGSKIRPVRAAEQGEHTPSDGSDGTDGTNGETGPPIDGNALLGQIADWIGQYLSVPSEHCITVVTLWAAHSHATDAFYVTPRLILDSAEPQSGKTRVLELLNLLVRAPIFTMNTTIAALYRRLATSPRTILLDETDAIFAKGAAQNHEDLRALLNAGYKRGATVDRCVTKAQEIEVVEFPAFAPAALAGIAGNMPDTITDRAVTISMRRRAPGEHIAEFIEEDAAAEAAPLQQALSRWMSRTAVDQLKGARPEMPEGVRDRKAEIWRALLAVADAAGGDWPKLARAACEHFVLNIDSGGQSLNIRLLADIRAVFDANPLADFMATNSLLSELKKIEDAPWSDFDLTARKLAFRLKRFGVEPRHDAAKTARGYYKINFSDAFSRYLQTTDPQSLPSEPSEPSMIFVAPAQSTDGSQHPTRPEIRPEDTDAGTHHWWLATNRPEHPGCAACEAKRPGTAA